MTKKKPKGKYRFGVKIYKLRRTKFWTQAQIDEAKQDAEMMLRIWK